MKVPGISGGWILIYSKRTRTPKGGKKAYRGQERLSTSKVAFTHNRHEISAQEEVIGICVDKVDSTPIENETTVLGLRQEPFVFFKGGRFGNEWVRCSATPCNRMRMAWAPMDDQLPTNKQLFHVTGRSDSGCINHALLE